MATSKKSSLDVSGHEGGNCIGILSNGHEIRDGQIPINLFSNGQDLNLEIINQYGQLMGEYSKLDDELWLGKPDDDDEVMAESNKGLDWNPISAFDNTVDIVQPSNVVKNSVSDGATTFAKESSSSLKDSSLAQSQTSSPVSVLHRKSDLLRSGSEEMDQNPDPKETPKWELPEKPVKKCLHCESIRTPQWREGPMGRFTLCNACGVQYRHGRLFPEYRPLRSPTYDPSLHSHLPKKVQQMRMSRVSFSQESTASAKESCSSLKDSSLHQSQTSSPASSLQRRKSYSNVITKAIKCARSKRRRHPVKCKSHKRAQTLSTVSVTTEQSDSFQCGSYVESPLFDELGEPLPSKQVRTKKVSDLLQSGSGEMDQNISERKAQKKGIPKAQSNPDPNPVPKRKLPTKLVKKLVKKCLHCESTKTPQWREGPMGQATLCNACGVQYRHGRLFPEYRPLRSPTYDPSLHSHLPKKVQQMRTSKNT